MAGLLPPNSRATGVNRLPTAPHRNLGDGRTSREEYAIPLLFWDRGSLRSAAEDC